MSENNETPSYYAILTANVRYDNDLTDSEKLLYAEITALSNKYGYCTASNKYFAKLYDVTDVTISRRISKLKQCGYLRIEQQRKGEKIVLRKIYITSVEERNGLLNTNVKRVVNRNDKKVLNTDDKKVLNTNVKENNTSNNTTSNNITRENHHHHYIENNNIYSSADDVGTNTVKGGGGSNPFTFFQENGFGVINGYIAQDIDEWRNDFKEHGDDMLVMAMKIAVDNNKATWSYTKSILKRWLNANITTPNDVKADEKANDTKKKYKDPDKMTHEERKIAMQDPAYWD
ncbi:DnaD domain protein [Staphylococcus chromogenes]|uniref:DnaD domain protein n=1 Tax=Staphylococcus chromogenes TaxID=46126 RepID=UPI0029023F86|nr:DnaD domain protein [Staphylococcus chromogenes]MDU0429174.1 DnaD domain protein [Staphylococcus chromogenes]